MLATFGEVSLCAGLGAFVSPYVIVFTNRHQIAASELDASGRKDLLDSLDACLATGLFHSGNLSIFEHAGRHSRSSTACIEHCHLHVIDGAHDVEKYLRDSTGSVEIGIGEHVALPEGCEYLFAGSYSGDRLIRGKLLAKAQCGGQLFRRRLADETGSLFWNWRFSPMPEVAIQLCQDWHAVTRLPGIEISIKRSATG